MPMPVRFSVLLLMNAALLHARLEDAKGQAADLARVGRLHGRGDRKRPGSGAAGRRGRPCCGTDYEPVFRPALDVLEALGCGRRARGRQSGGASGRRLGA